MCNPGPHGWYMTILHVCLTSPELWMWQIGGGTSLGSWHTPATWSKDTQGTGHGVWMSGWPVLQDMVPHHILQLSSPTTFINFHQTHNWNKQVLKASINRLCQQSPHQPPINLFHLINTTSFNPVSTPKQSLQPALSNHITTDKKQELLILSKGLSNSLLIPGKELLILSKELLIT
jgi:hypothetical protein